MTYLYGVPPSDNIYSVRAIGRGAAHEIVPTQKSEIRSAAQGAASE